MPCAMRRTIVCCPRGSQQTADDEVSVRGAAAQDANFNGGGIGWCTRWQLGTRKGLSRSKPNCTSANLLSVGRRTCASTDAPGAEADGWVLRIDVGWVGDRSRKRRKHHGS